jgi:hypothetical protein
VRLAAGSFPFQERPHPSGWGRSPSFMRRSLVRSRERLGHDAGHEPPEHDAENKNRGDPKHEIDQRSEIARGGPSSHLRTIGGFFALQITDTTDAHRKRNLRWPARRK